MDEPPGEPEAVAGTGASGRDASEAPRVARPTVFEHNVRYNNLSGLFQVLSLHLAQPFFGIFAVRSGATNVQLGLLSSLPAIMNFVALVPGGRFIDRFPRKQRVTAAFILASRAFFVLLALVPWLAPGREAAVFVALVGLMSLPAAVGNLGWQSFIAGALPADRRAMALAYRQRLMGLATMAVVLVAGAFIDALPFPAGYQTVFLLALAFSLGEVAAFLRMVEGPAEGACPEATSAGGSAAGARPEAGGWLAEFGAHPRFVRFTAASLFFYLAWQMAWPVFTRYQVTELGATNLWISVFTVAGTLSAVLTYGWWARRAGRRGSLQTLALAVVGLATIPLGYSFLPSLPVVAAFHFWTGIFGNGVVLLLLNSLLDVVPAERRTTYLAYYSALTSLVSFAAPMVGVALLDHWGFVTAFRVPFMLRLVAAFCFYLVAVSEAGDRRAAASGGRAHRA